MRLEPSRCEYLLRAAGRGVLATVHPERGADAVPACFAVDADTIVVPVDRVKPKSTVVLQRTKNLERDGRATLLCDHWDAHDWTRLWWVRVSMEAVAVTEIRRRRLEALLKGKYPQYGGTEFAELLVFRITGIDGWSGGDRP